MTRLILATQPWSHVAIVAVFICAMPTATASPLVVISTTCARWVRRCRVLTCCLQIVHAIKVPAAHKLLQPDLYGAELQDW